MTRPRYRSFTRKISQTEVTVAFNPSPHVAQISVFFHMTGQTLWSKVGSPPEILTEYDRLRKDQRALYAWLLEQKL